VSKEFKSYFITQIGGNNWGIGSDATITTDSAYTISFCTFKHRLSYHCKNSCCKIQVSLRRTLILSVC